jgi:hypothetical protein
VSVLKNRHLLDWGRLSSRTAAYRTLTPAAYTVKFVSICNMTQSCSRFFTGNHVWTADEFGCKKAECWCSRA